MKYCTHCGAEIHDEAVVCPKCGCAVGPYAETRQTSRGGGWNILAIVGFALSFFNAVVGLILSAVGRKQISQSGEKGKELAVAGIVISAVQIAWVTLGFVFLFALFIMRISSSGRI